MVKFSSWKCEGANWNRTWNIHEIKNKSERLLKFSKHMWDSLRVSGNVIVDYHKILWGSIIQELFIYLSSVNVYNLLRKKIIYKTMEIPWKYWNIKNMYVPTCLINE